MPVIPSYVVCRYCQRDMYACEDGYECANENMEYREDCPYFIQHGQGYYLTYKAGRAQWSRRVKKEADALQWWYA